MSAATGTNTDIARAYVRLLGEGTVVYRAAPATPVGVDTVLLVAPEGYDDEDEEWEFPPGSVVRVERRILEGVSVFVAVALGSPTGT